MIRAATILLALAACAGPGIRSVNDSVEYPPADPTAPLPPPPPRSCASSLVLAPTRHDRLFDSAAALRVTNSRAWWTRSLMGPYPTREDAMADCADVTALPAATPLEVITHCTTRNPKRPAGPKNLGRHVLLLRTARGWWRHPLAEDHWPKGDPNDQPRVVTVRELTASDRIGDGGHEVSMLVEEGPPGAFQTRRLLLCGVGPAGVPACADIRVESSGPVRGAGTCSFKFELTCDGKLSMTGWEGGMSTKLVHTAGTLSFP